MTCTSILVKWDNVCNDEGWMSALFSWYERRTLSVLVDVKKRAKVFEYCELTHAGVLHSKESGVFATYTTPTKPLAPVSRVTVEKSFPVRFSDQHVLKHTPLCFYYQFMTCSVDEERAITSCCQLDVHITDLAKVGNRVDVKYMRASQAQYQFEVRGQFGDLLCLGMFETLAAAPIETRYDMTRVVETSKLASTTAAKSRDMLGFPVQERTPFFEFELSGTQTGNGWLHLADIAVSQVWEHAFPPGSEFFTALQPGNGKRQYSCMWRGATAQIFDHASVHDSPSSEFFCMVWIDRTGTSTLDVRADFTTKHTGKLVCAVRFTIIVVDIPIMKPRPVFYDKKWAEKRYTYGAKSPIKASSFSLPDVSIMWNELPTLALYELRLRHTDLDLNGHLNSGRFMCMVEDARQLAMDMGKIAKQVEGNWIKNFWVEYNSELHMSKEHHAYIEVRFQVTKEGRVLSRFEFLYGGEKRIVCCVVTVESPPIASSL